MDDGVYIWPGQMGDDDRGRIDHATGTPIGGVHHYGGWFRDHDNMAFADNDPMAGMYGMAPDPYDVYHSPVSDYGSSGSNTSYTPGPASPRRPRVDDTTILLLLFHNS